MFSKVSLLPYLLGSLYLPVHLQRSSINMTSSQCHKTLNLARTPRLHSNAMRCMVMWGLASASNTTTTNNNVHLSCALQTNPSSEDGVWLPMFLVNNKRSHTQFPHPVECIGQCAVSGTGIIFFLFKYSQL